MTESVKKLYILLVIISVLFAQILNIINWHNKKQNYYIDELYSMEYAHYITGATEDRFEYFTNYDWFRDGNVVYNREFRDRLSVNDKISVVNTPLDNTIRRIIVGRSSTIFLNLFMSVFDNGNPGSVGSIYLNILLFIFSFVLFGVLTQKLTNNIAVAIPAMIMYGFSYMVVSMADYVRFYMQVIVLELLILIFHLVMLETKRIRIYILCELLSFVCMYFCLKCSELTVILSASLAISLSIVHIIRKEYAKLCYYMTPLLLVGIIVIIDSGWMTVFLHPEKLDLSTGALSTVYINIHDLSLYTFIQRMILFAINISLGVFGSRYSLLLFLLFGVSVYIILSRRRINSEKSKQKKSNFCNDNRLVFIAMLCITVAIYGLITVIFGLLFLRYSLQGLIPVLVIVWGIIGYLHSEYSKMSAGKTFLSITLGLSIVASLFANLRPDMEYTFSSDKQFLDDIKRIDAKSVIYFSGEIHPFYDLVINMDESKLIYRMDDEIVCDILPENDTYLIWSAYWKEPDFREMENNGYRIEYIGNDHVSRCWAAYYE